MTPERMFWFHSLYISHFSQVCDVCDGVVGVCDVCDGVVGVCDVCDVCDGVDGV